MAGSGRESVQVFRQSFREAEIGPNYSGAVHFVFTNLSCVILIGICLINLEQVQPLEWWAIPLTFIYANLVEYWGHRVPMHRPVSGLRLIYKRHAKQHHRFFTHKEMVFDSRRDYKAVLFPPVLIVFFVVLGLPFWLLINFLFSANAAWLAIATGIAYFLNYEWLHFAYHCAADSAIGRIPGVQRLRQLHRHHHNPELMARQNFNITYPLGDWIFGSLHRASEKDDNTVTSEYEVIHQENRFVLPVDGDEVVLKYRMLADDHVDFTSTFTPPPLRGRGLARIVVTHGLNWAESKGLKINATCWYVAKLLAEREPD